MESVEQNFLEILAESYDFDDFGNISNIGNIYDDYLGIGNFTRLRGIPRMPVVPFMTNFPTNSVKKYFGEIDKEKFNVHDKTCVICHDIMDIGIDIHKDTNTDININLESSCEDDNQIVSLSCLHHFHTKCIFQWLEKNLECPCCREKCTRWNCENKEFEPQTIESVDWGRHEQYPYHIINFRRWSDNTQTQTQTQTQQRPHRVARILLPNQYSLTRIETVSGIVEIIVSDILTQREIIVLPELDVFLVQNQALCTYEDAIKALVSYEGDIVNAIMDLTMG